MSSYAYSTLQTRPKPYNCAHGATGCRENTAKVCATFLALCPCAFALNPSLDINQYAHTAWTVREGFFKGTITSIAQTPDGYLWLGTEFGLLRFDGVRSVPWQPPAGEHLPSRPYSKPARRARWASLDWHHEGLASWKDGKLTHYPELAGQAVVRSLRIVKERSGPAGVASHWETLRDSERQRHSAPERTAVSAAE